MRNGSGAEELAAEQPTAEQPSLGHWVIGNSQQPSSRYLRCPELASRRACVALSLSKRRRVNCLVSFEREQQKKNPFVLSCMQKTVRLGYLKWLIVVAFAFTSGIVKAQDVKDINARSPHSAPSSRQQKKADKKKADQKKLAEKAIEKGRKNHEKLQTREVRRRMRQSKRKASMNNAHQREFFLKRWFTRDHRTRSR